MRAYFTCWLGKTPFKRENPLFLCSGLPALLWPVLYLLLLSVQVIVSAFFNESLAQPLEEAGMEFVQRKIRTQQGNYAKIK